MTNGLLFGVFLYGTLCLWIWQFGVESPVLNFGDGVTTKAVTAYGFMIAAPMVYTATRINRANQHVAEAVVWGLASAQLLGLIQTLNGYLLGYLEFFGILPETPGSYTVGGGLPSLGTSACFLLLTAACFLRAYRKWVRTVRGLAIVTVLAGLSAWLGHWTDVPTLYFFFEGKSTGMAKPTATLFVILGAVLWRKAVAQSDSGSVEQQ